MEDALLFQLRSAIDKYTHQAQLLEDAMAGAGTKDYLLVSRVVRFRTLRPVPCIPFFLLTLVARLGPQPHGQRPRGIREALQHQPVTEDQGGDQWGLREAAARMHRGASLEPARVDAGISMFWRCVCISPDWRTQGHEARREVMTSSCIVAAAVLSHYLSCSMFNAPCKSFLAMILTWS